MVRLGQALKLDVKARSGPSEQAIVRMVGRQDRAFDMLSWSVPVPCNATEHRDKSVILRTASKDVL